MDVFGKLGAWAAAHRTGVLAGGGAGVAGVALLLRRRGKTAAAGADPGTAAAAPAGVDTTAGGISSSDAFGIMLGQQQAFQNSVQGQLAAFAQRYPPRPAAAVSPRPYPPRPTPGIYSLLEHRRATTPLPVLPSGWGGVATARPILGTPAPGT